MNTIGVAVVGTGFMGWVHLEALRRVGVTVIGLLGSSERKTHEAAERLGVPRAFRSYEDLLADSSVRAVHIGTPNRHHFAMAKAALEAGKHVMCEKPLAMTAAESAELVRLATAHPELAAGVNYNIRFYPLCLETRDRIARGDAGAMFHITGSYLQDWLLAPTDYNWRVLADEGGALRAVADIGTHWLDLIQFISGCEVSAVCADLQTVHPVRQRSRGDVPTFERREESRAETEAVAIDTEDAGAILLRFRGGARGSLHVSQVTAGRKNCLRFEIAAARQSFAWNSELPNELWIGGRDGANQILHRDPALLSEAARSAADYPGGHNEGYADSFKQHFRAFYRYIKAGDFAAPPPFATFAEGHREIVLCEAILESHRSGRWIEVPESPR